MFLDPENSEMDKKSSMNGSFFFNMLPYKKEIHIERYTDSRLYRARFLKRYR